MVQLIGGASLARRLLSAGGGIQPGRTLGAGPAFIKSVIINCSRAWHSTWEDKKPPRGHPARPGAVHAVRRAPERGPTGPAARATPSRPPRRPAAASARAPPPALNFPGLRGPREGVGWSEPPKALVPGLGRRRLRNPDARGAGGERGTYGTGPGGGGRGRAGGGGGGGAEGSPVDSPFLPGTSPWRQFRPPRLPRWEGRGNLGCRGPRSSPRTPSRDPGGAAPRRAASFPRGQGAAAGPGGASSPLGEALIQ